MKLFLESAAEHEVQRVYSVVRKAFDLQTYPYVFGEIHAYTTSSFMGYSRIVQVTCATFPDHMFAMALDPVDYTREDTALHIGVNAGQYFAAISNPVPANIVLGEN